MPEQQGPVDSICGDIALYPLRVWVHIVVTTFCMQLEITACKKFWRLCVEVGMSDSKTQNYTTVWLYTSPVSVCSKWTAVVFNHKYTANSVHFEAKSLGIQQDLNPLPFNRGANTLPLCYRCCIFWPVFEQQILVVLVVGPNALGYVV